MKNCLIFTLVPSLVAVCLSLWCGTARATDDSQDKATRELVALVKDAAERVHAKGEAAFTDFRLSGSRWRQGESYIFVLDPQGHMLVHPDPAMEGKNELDLKDINGKPIIPDSLLRQRPSPANRKAGTTTNSLCQAAFSPAGRAPTCGS